MNQCWTPFERKTRLETGYNFFVLRDLGYPFCKLGTFQKPSLQTVFFLKRGHSLIYVQHSKPEADNDKRQDARWVDGSIELNII